VVVMGGSERSDDPAREIVSVTEHGPVTVPERFREQLGIETPGGVVFRKTDDGKVLIEPIRSPSEMRGFAVRDESSADTLGADLLREMRDNDR